MPMMELEAGSAWEVLAAEAKHRKHGLDLAGCHHQARTHRLWPVIPLIRRIWRVRGRGSFVVMKSDPGESAAVGRGGGERGA
jgi:hypothetical protein